MTTVAAAGTRPAPHDQFPRLGSWVEFHQEPCRGGRSYQLLVNHRTHQAIGLTAAEADLCRRLQAGRWPDQSDPAAEAFLRELAGEGFLASNPPPARPGRRLTASAATLDVAWNGADRLVRAAHDHGGRHLFHPLAIAAQIILAAAGLAAVAAAIGSPQTVHLRVHPAQIPAVLGLSLAAIAVHEFAHALVVVHYRRRVDAAGIRLHLGTPAFYVQATGALLLTRRQRLLQAAAGVWAEWLFTAAAALMLWAAPWSPAAPIVHRFVLAQRRRHRHQSAPLHRPGRLLAARRRPPPARPRLPLPRLAHPAHHRAGGQDPGHRHRLGPGRLPRRQRRRRRRPARHCRILLVPDLR